VIWKVVERTITYIFILGILYILSETILQWNRDAELQLFKIEMRREIQEEMRELTKNVIRQEVNSNNTNIALTGRVNAIEEIVSLNRRVVLRLQEGKSPNIDDVGLGN
jgi:hypothetical protein